jgi:hypothetical protein
MVKVSLKADEYPWMTLSLGYRYLGMFKDRPIKVRLKGPL